MRYLFICAVQIITVLIQFANSQNPFKNGPMYVNPVYQANVDKAIIALQARAIGFNLVGRNLQIARNQPTAYWIDSISKVQPNSMSLNTMNGILQDASKKSSPAPIVVFVLYNMPNRDCNMPSSLGEICCGTVLPNGQCDYMERSDCSLGLKIYKTDYIDKIVSIVNQYKDTVPMTFIIEPNSFANLIRNRKAKCGIASQTAIKEGIAYAVGELHKVNIPTYLYMAYGTWLGFSANSNVAIDLLKSLPFTSQLRGFAVNVANYQPLGLMCPQPNYCQPSKKNWKHPCCMDVCKLNSKANSANTEMNYAQLLQDQFPNMTVVIDTGRNGNVHSRENCYNSCNVKRAGFGVLPTAYTQIPFVDAYLWIKPPGESDGCTENLPDGQKCPSFIYPCGSLDSFTGAIGEPRMPQFGGFSEQLIISLAQNANFNVSSASTEFSLIYAYGWACLCIGLLSLYL